jgi:phage host-nuclease inhibitor protein Gam
MGKNGSAFDKVAQTGKAPTAATKVKTAAVLTPALQDKVDDYIQKKGQIKALESEMKDISLEVCTEVRKQQDDLAYNGQFTNSMTVQGRKASAIFISADSFSVPQEEDTLEELKKLLGKKFDDFFQTKRTIALKDSVINNAEMLDRIAAVCEKAGMNIGEIFDVRDKTLAVDGLDEKQYQLPRDKLPVFRSLVKQKSPYLK